MTAPKPRAGAGLTAILALLAFYAAATAICAVLLVLLLYTGAVAAIQIMFYRGLLALALSGCLTIAALALLAPRLPERYALSARDAAGAGAVACSILLAVFVVGPVTVDRSVSVFMLSQFERAQAPMSREAARDAFVETYVDGWDQIGRRLREQEISGNLEQTPRGWRLTAQGRSFMRIARIMSWTFGGDPRFVGADAAPPPAARLDARTQEAR